jgi:hypothetical protein
MAVTFFNTGAASACWFCGFSSAKTGWNAAKKRKTARGIKINLRILLLYRNSPLKANTLLY